MAERGWFMALRLRLRAWRAGREPKAARPEPDYVTGTGQELFGVHELSHECITEGCVIHNPSDPNQDWPTHWREDRGIMERICPHGVGHPDKDEVSYRSRHNLSDDGTHGCDGCCAQGGGATPAPTVGSVHKPSSVSPSKEAGE